MDKIRKYLSITILLLCFILLVSCNRDSEESNDNIDQEKTECHSNKSENDSSYWTEEKMDKAIPPDIREK